jgi:diacylglycerol kinase family enzyme
VYHDYHINMSTVVPPSRDSGVDFPGDSTKHGPLPSYLNTNVSLHVLISILSGSHTAHEFFKSNIKADLDAIHPSYMVTLTKSPNTIREFTKSVVYPTARAGKEQTIILLSGDGGIIDIVDTLHSCIAANVSHSLASYKSPNVALLPLGTANAFANSTNIGDPKVAISRLFAGTPRAIPTFTVSFSPGAQLVGDEGRAHTPISAPMHGSVVFSWGLHASLVSMSDTAEYRKHGIERFKIAAGELMKEPHAYHGRVSILPSAQHSSGSRDWTPLQHADKGIDEHSYILATLVSRLEATFVISPRSQPLSCNLRLVALPHLEAAELGKILGLAYQGGKHVEEKHVTYREIDGVRIEFKEEEGRWRTICVDGRIVEVEEEGWVEVRREGEEGRVVSLIC